MTKRAGGRCAPQATDRRCHAAHVYAQAAVHRHAKTLVEAIPSVIPRHILHRAWTQNRRAIERPKVEQHLVECHHIRRRGITTSPRDSGPPEGWGIAVREKSVLSALGALVGPHYSVVQGIWHPDP